VLQEVPISPVLRTPYLDTVLQVRSHQEINHHAMLAEIHSWNQICFRLLISSKLFRVWKAHSSCDNSQLLGRGSILFLFDPTTSLPPRLPAPAFVAVNVKVIRVTKEKSIR